MTMTTPMQFDSRVRRPRQPRREHIWPTACARRIKVGIDYQWVWYDKWGKDYGPWATKHTAETLGPQAAAKEEKLLRMSHSG